MTGLSTLARSRLVRFGVTPVTLAAFLSACGYKYQPLASPYAESVDTVRAREDNPQRSILRVVTGEGVTHTLRFVETRSDSLIGVANFERSSALQPDTMSLAWSDIASVELRTGQDSAGLGVLGIGVGALFVVGLIALSSLEFPDFTASRSKVIP